MDCAGGAVRGALGVREAEAVAAAAGEECRLGAEPNRRVRPGAVGKRGAEAVAGGGPVRPDPPALARPDRAAAGAGRGGGVCQRFFTRRVREAGRSPARVAALRDRKSTRLNSSHTVISYAVFCLKKKKTE